MRRSDREVTDPVRIKEILDQARIMRIAYSDDEGLTIVPVTFVALDDEAGGLVLGFHGAKAGRKFEAFSKGCEAAFECEAGVSPIISDIPASNSWVYESVIGHGTVERVNDPEAKKKILDALVAAHTGRDCDVPLEQTDWTAVYALKVSSLSAKSRQR